MEWTELTPINITNLNDLEARITAANQNVSDAKTPLAAAIAAMGQASTAADSFVTMATKIRDISDDANALVSEVQNGKTFYQGGLKRTGTLAPSATDIRKNTVIAGVTGKWTGIDTITAGDIWAWYTENDVDLNVSDNTTYLKNTRDYIVSYAGTIRIKFGFHPSYNNTGYAKIYKK